MEYLWAFLLLLGTLCSWLLNFLGLPGNWLVVAILSLYVFLEPSAGRFGIGWVVFAVVLTLATLGEIFEFFAGAWSAAKAGGGKSSGFAALIGSIIGGLVGLFVGIPIPIIGSLVAALLFASLGAMIGAFVAEQWKGRELEHSLKVGGAAFGGRLVGTTGKILAGAMMAVLILAALLI